jgi:hypothetical protein
MGMEEPLEDIKAYSAEQALAIFLYIVGQNATFRAAGELFDHGPSTVSRAFHAVLEALLRYYPSVVSLPQDSVPSRILNNPKAWPFFEDCRGALDGTHIGVALRNMTANEMAPFRNRKGVFSQNVMAAVDFEMNFVYVLPGWEGSAHDGRVLLAAKSKGFTMPPGKYYLADAGYSISQHLILSLYRRVRYHLREWRGARQKPATKEELFNLRHSQFRNVIGRCFGVWKQRFTILRNGPN